MSSYSNPDCPCFTDPRMMPHVMQNSVVTAQTLGSLFLELTDHAQLCNKSLPMMLEMVIINIGVIIATQGTIIEMGSDEALWETQRVLRGIEQRVMERLVLYHEEAKKHPEVAEKYNAMRSDR